MTREIEVSVAGTVVAVGTFDYCADALGYARSTLVSYASSSLNTPLHVKKLPAMYRLDGKQTPMSEEEACRKTGWSPRKLQIKAATENYRYVHRCWHGNWSLPLEEVEQLKDKAKEKELI